MQAAGRQLSGRHQAPASGLLAQHTAQHSSNSGLCCWLGNFLQYPTGSHIKMRLLDIRVGAPAEEPCGHKQALRGVTSHLITDMCMYSHANVGVSPRNCGKAMV
eukprot:COSAG01_NODE_16_length_40091_cov_15.728646_22_plen_104_part_00